MKKNYTAMFLLFFAASIAAGLGLKSFVPYSMVIGASFGVVFLLCSAYFAGKKDETMKAQ
ncbi:hypothetical protein [Mangrovibacillus cuniculi]|uniref:DUF5325 family protein n=1 Tax=Mangrovibacillus cuniculi TaxID=2593652 RepID=A0A7S8C9R6_9BACI|nr:hypothetical protein [Mangrovibacillus cuniculi]QPC45866.1 hypothetical protein G8O30_02280 [Mangrovibacillus cuniculi]